VGLVAVQDRAPLTLGKDNGATISALHVSVCRYSRQRDFSYADIPMRGSPQRRHADHAIIDSSDGADLVG
jgi:hypothetical protein